MKTFIHIAGTLLVFAFVNIARAQTPTLELKGYKPGMPMPLCPAETTSQHSESSKLKCMLGSTTLANQAVDNVLLEIVDGKLSAVTFVLNEKFPGSNLAVFNALKERFGTPTGIDRAHLNEYTWHRLEDQTVMWFNGRKGFVIIKNMDLERRARETSTKENKKDI